MQTDLQLLAKYQQRGDAHAFRDLVNSHAGMVHATARRITQDDAIAQDVTQETFVKLARQSRSVTESVAAWLHRVASRLACNVVRDDSTRRKHEGAAAVTSAADEGKESPWSEVEPALDEVINELPEDQRAPLVMHFLEGRSQRDIARELKVNQSTVSRAIESGLIELRKRLRSRGVFCTAGLGALLLANTASAAPVPMALIASLTKVGMAGVGGGTLLPTTAAGIGGALLWKLIAAAAVVTVGVVTIGAVTTRSQPDNPKPPTQTATAVNAPQAVSAPARQRSTIERQPSAESEAANLPVMPVHELVHSFPQALQRPFGAMVRVDGWVWGTTASGGEYGMGTIFRVKVDGTEWQDVIAFNGRAGTPRGERPRGLIMARDGTLWGATESGGVMNEGTLFCLNRTTGEFNTVIDFGPETGRLPGVAVAEAPDGSIWGTTYSTVFRFDRQRSELTNIATFTGNAGLLPGTRAYGGLATDGNGLLWGTTMYGGASNVGTIFKVDVAARTVVCVAQFTGANGALPGNGPDVPPTPDGRGCVWGVTQYGGADDSGVVFRLDVASNSCRTIVQFTPKGQQTAGTNPMAALAVDDDGHLWGGTRFLGGYGKSSGNVFKIDRNTERLTTEIAFTSRGGARPGGPLRGPMLSDGAGGLIGICNFGGAADFGTMFRFNPKTSSFTLLRDMADLATSKEGADPRGRMVAGIDGSLWGVAENGGVHHRGAVFKFDPTTDELTTVVDFTDKTGAFKGSFPRAGLTSDGHGFLWGVTTGGGANERGTIYKIEERTGAFITVHEFGLPDKRAGPAGSGPETELVNDHKGYLWGTTKFAVYKIHIQSGAVKVVAKFRGDREPLHGSEPEGLALDNQGFIWGAAFGEPRRKSSGTIFKIDTATDALTVIENLRDARRGSSSAIYRQGDMYADGQGNVWFAGSYARGTTYSTRTLVKMNATTGTATAWYRQPGFEGITTPVIDDRGLLWGLSDTGGAPNKGSVYCFDPATQKFTTVMAFTGAGPQPMAGAQPERTRLYRHSDGNLYGGTRYGGPGNGGTVFRLRFGPTPLTQEATLFADGRVELHGTLRPNGKDSEAVFEWGTEPSLSNAASASAGTVKASESAQSVTTVLTGLKPGATYYFRLRGKNDNNRIPQRGAVLSFTTATTGLASVDKTNASNTSATNKAQSLATQVATSATGHALTVVRIPGAGAGFVRGALRGKAYEIGKRYTLNAVSDNDYIFSHWSGPGISGARAESRGLSFVFTAEMAQSPVITATFVKNPFRKDVIGEFTGLVLAADGVATDVTTTGAARLSVTSTGSFSGELRYDRQRITLAGSFDNGGLARFGHGRTPSLLVTTPNGGKPLHIAMQLGLNEGGSSGITGNITTLDGDKPTLRSLFDAERSGLTRLAKNENRRLILNESPDGAVMQLSVAGNAVFATRLSDGTAVLCQAPITQSNQAAMFMQLYPGLSGSFGGMITLNESAAEPKDQPFWWSRPGNGWQTIAVRQAH